MGNDQDTTGDGVTVNDGDASTTIGFSQGSVQVGNNREIES